MSTLTASSNMEIAKGGISGRSPEVQPQRLIQRSVMAHSKAFVRRQSCCGVAPIWLTAPEGIC